MYPGSTEQRVSSWKKRSTTSLTQTGKQVKANLYANVFAVEHEKGDAAHRAV
jgi:hypothetical protein